MPGTEHFLRISGRGVPCRRTAFGLGGLLFSSAISCEAQVAPRDLWRGRWALCCRRPQRVGPKLHQSYRLAVPSLISTEGRKENEREGSEYFSEVENGRRIRRQPVIAGEPRQHPRSNRNLGGRSNRSTSSRLNQRFSYDKVYRLTGNRRSSLPRSKSASATKRNVAGRRVGEWRRNLSPATASLKSHPRPTAHAAPTSSALTPAAPPARRADVRRADRAPRRPRVSQSCAHTSPSPYLPHYPLCRSVRRSPYLYPPCTSYCPARKPPRST